MSNFDWNTERNLASDVICDGLRVSTGVVATYPFGMGKMTYIETFIFSDLPSVKSEQIHDHMHNPEKALEQHAQIVAKLREALETPNGH